MFSLISSYSFSSIFPIDDSDNKATTLNILFQLLLGGALYLRDFMYYLINSQNNSRSYVLFQGSVTGGERKAKQVTQNQTVVSVKHAFWAVLSKAHVLSHHDHVTLPKNEMYLTPRRDLSRCFWWALTGILTYFPSVTLQMGVHVTS